MDVYLACGTLGALPGPTTALVNHKDNMCTNTKYGYDLQMFWGRVDTNRALAARRPNRSRGSLRVCRKVARIRELGDNRRVSKTDMARRKRYGQMGVGIFCEQDSRYGEVFCDGEQRRYDRLGARSAGARRAPGRYAGDPAAAVEVHSLPVQAAVRPDRG